MIKFRYTIGPSSSGGFTTRPVFNDQLTEATLTADLAATTGLTPAQVEAVLRAFGARMLLAASDSQWSSGLYDTFAFRPTSGGRTNAVDGFHTAVEMNAGVSINFLAEQIDAWQNTLSLESQGEVGKVSPTIDTIINLDNDLVNKYAAGHLIELRGDHLKLTKTDLSQGVFFQSGTAAEVRATVYGNIDPKSLTVQVPSTLTGAQRVRVVAQINGSNRSFTYMDLITP